jgi:hypothetical protein
MEVPVLSRIRPKLTYANVVSTMCLFLLLGGGGAWAAAKLAKNSVGTAQLKNGAVTGSKVANGSLTADDLSPTVATGSSSNSTHASEADHAKEADHARLADLATEAGHAAEADHALTADFASSAKHALEADNALEANHSLTADLATEANHSKTADLATNASNAGNSDLLGGLEPSAYGSVLTSSMVLCNQGPAYWAVSGYNDQLCAAQSVYADSLTPDTTLTPRDLAVQVFPQLDAGRTLNIQLMVDDVPTAFSCQVVDPGTTCTFGGGTTTIPAASRISLRIGVTPDLPTGLWHVYVGFRLTAT